MQFTVRVTARLVVLLAVLAVTVLLGLWWKRRQGVVRAVADGDVLAAADLGTDLGSAATLVQFSSVACAPCRAARRVLADVAASTPGVRHVELDAAEHLPLVRRLNILRTPTVLVLDEGGRVAHRLSGVPDLAALHQALPTRRKAFR